MTTKLFFLSAIAITILCGCKDPNSTTGPASDFSEFVMPEGQTHFEIAIYPDGWIESGSPKLKQFKNVTEDIIREELAKLDWVTAGRYEGDDRRDVPEFILGATDGNPQLRASGSTGSDDDYKLTCHCRYVDNTGMNHYFESKPIDDPNILADVFISFFQNDDQWKTIVEWPN